MSDYKADIEAERTVAKERAREEAEKLARALERQKRRQAIEAAFIEEMAADGVHIERVYFDGYATYGYYAYRWVKPRFVQKMERLFYANSITEAYEKYLTYKELGRI